MTADLGPYPEYKESGLPWLGRIPAHWEEKRAKYYFKEVDERSTTGEEKLLSVSHKTGVTPRKAHVTMFMAESNTGHKICHPGDLVINTMWAWMAAMGVASETGLVSPSYGVYRSYTSSSFIPNYLDHLVRVQPYVSEYICRSTGIRASRLRLYPDDFLDIPIACPPIQEQESIVRFIVHNDRRISRFIRNRRRLVEVLNEQKQAIIHQAVTRGLDPNAKLKQSGVEWIGDIPENWKTRRIKTVAKILRGKFSHRPRNDPSLYDGEFPFIQTGDVARANKYIIGYKQTLNERGYAVSKEFPKGTLTMTIAANIGDVAILDFAACFPDSIVGFVPYEGIFLEFLFYLFTAMKMEFLKEAPVNTQGNLNTERIGSMFVAIPDFETQRSLVAAIESKTYTIDKAISHSQREIDLIRKYRACLIADVVTGKLDVRPLSPGIGDRMTELADFDKVMDIEYQQAEEELPDMDEVGRE